MRKLIFLILILLLLAIGLWWLTNVFALFGGQKATFRHLPASSLAVFHTSNVQQLLSETKQSEQWEQLKEFDWIARFSELQEQVALLFQGEEDKIRKMPVTASLHITAPQKYDYLLHVKSSSMSWFRLRYFIGKVEQKGYTLEKRTFNGIPIFEISGKAIDGGELNRPITIAQKGSILLISHEATLVEEAVNEGDSKLQAAALESLNIGKAQTISAYFHFKNLPYLNTIFTKADKPTLFDYLENATTGLALTAKHLEDQKSWDIQGKWVGTSNDRSDNESTNIFQTNLSQTTSLSPSTISSFVPANIALLVHSQRSVKTEAIASIQNEYENYIGPWLDKEWAWFIPERQYGELGSCLLIKSKDIVRTRSLLNRWTGHTESIEEEFNYRNFLLKPIEEPALAQLFLGDLGKEYFQNAWFTLLEDYVLLASNKETMQAVLDQQINQRTLSKEETYANYINSGVSEEGINVLLQSNFLLPTLNINPAPDFEQELKSKSSSISQFSPAFFTMGAQSISGTIQYGQSYKASSITLWNAILDAPPVSRPQVIYNDVSDKNEIFVQDAKDILYLLNNEGQIVWKTDLTGAVMGEIHLVNLYNNDDRQYLFNTRNEIYLVDNRGDLVQNFPLRLTAPTETGMLFAENNIYIPCTNEKIYGYSLTGKLLNGWNPNEESLGAVNLPLMILEQEDNWFLIAANESGTVNFLNRFGELEFVSILGSPLISPLQIDRREGFDIALATCQDGKTYTINQEGVYWAKNYLRLDSTASFISDNILSSEAEELLFANSEYLSIFNTKEKLKEFNLGCAISDMFTSQIEGIATKRVGAFCADIQQAWLFDYDKVYDGFPITTTTPFMVTDLYNKNENFVISGGTNNEVFAFRIK